MRGRVAKSLSASPVLVGAVTVLIIIVAVFLSYNANSGLPFVPTYDLKVELPSGSGLVVGNDVRVGGKRVGQVTEITTKSIEQAGEPLTIAQLEVKLDRSLQPLSEDTRILVRPRSALGLKYVEVTPGEAGGELQPGDTIPLANASAPVELEDLLSTFDAETRVAARAALEGYGDAFAGRGPDLNAAIAAFAPFFRHLTPVMEALSDPDTELDQLFTQIGAAAAQAAPVADVQAALFTAMADTFEAIGRHPEALRQTIERSPGTMDAAIRSFRVQRPFLSDFTTLSRELIPASDELTRALPPLNDALRVGTPVLLETPRTNRLAAATLRELDRLAENPSTLLALQELDTTLDVGRPLVEFVAPYQTVCNFANYFFTPLGEHISEEVPRGTIERIQLVTANAEQDDSVGHSDADRPADVPQGQDPQAAPPPGGSPETKLNTQFYAPAVDAAGKADCQAGQTGYPDGPLNTTGRYAPSPDPNQNGGSHVVIDSDTPGLAGGTYKSRELGIDGLEDVP
ncbi:MAG TPA: MlaD family protein [Thermoleophilaceae bacterium]|nr:MlaD family protein [Thermoleophilaceae bacterium]